MYPKLKPVRPIFKKRRSNWRSVLAFWAAVSAAGWVVIVALLSIIPSDHASQAAVQPGTMGLSDTVPASGSPLGWR